MASLAGSRLGGGKGHARCKKPQQTTAQTCLSFAAVGSQPFASRGAAYEDTNTNYTRKHTNNERRNKPASHRWSALASVAFVTSKPKYLALMMCQASRSCRITHGLKRVSDKEKTETREVKAKGDRVHLGVHFCSKSDVLSGIRCAPHTNSVHPVPRPRTIVSLPAANKRAQTSMRRRMRFITHFRSTLGGSFCFKVEMQGSHSEGKARGPVGKEEDTIALPHTRVPFALVH